MSDFFRFAEAQFNRYSFVKDIYAILTVAYLIGSLILNTITKSFKKQTIQRQYTVLHPTSKNQKSDIKRYADFTICPY